MVLLCIAFLEEREYVEKLGRIKDDLSPPFLLLPASNADKPHLSYPIATNAS